MKKPWFIKTHRTLGWRDRLRVLLGQPIRLRFDSPDGECHAACSLTISVGGREE
jgi:hypothetical protein